MQDPDPCRPPEGREAPRAAPPADPEALRALAREISRGGLAAQELARRPGRVTVRAEAPGGPVVVKLWNLSDARSRIRRLAGRTKGRAEWTSLSRLHRGGAAVPEPLAFFPLAPGAAHHEALVLQDLAPCEGLFTSMHRSAKDGDRARVRAQGAQVIALTRALLAAGILDNDHRIANFVERADGTICRLDLENAWRTRLPLLRGRIAAAMLGGLLGSHIWVCRDAPDLSRDFALELLEAVRPDRRLLGRIRAVTLAAVDRRIARSGYPLSRDLGW